MGVSRFTITTKSIRVKYVYKVKYKPDSIVQKYKVKLVVKGYAQQQNINYFETFSPFVRFEIIRIILALAVQMKWKVF